MGFADELMNAVSKTALTHCSVAGNTVNVSVFFSNKEMGDMGQGGVMLAVPRRMEGLIKEEAGKDLFLPEYFFEHMEYEDVEGGKVFEYSGSVSENERGENVLYEAMDDMGVPRPIED